MEEWVLIWLVAAVVFAIIEAITAGLVTIWFVGGSLCAMVLAFFNIHPIIQVVVFAVSSILLLIFTRPFAAKFLKVRHIGTNADRLIGMKALVIEEINNTEGTGQVKVAGQVWSARSVDESIVKPGTFAVVTEISGAKLMVKPE
ncbi:MAG TPA: NfeD family protein [Clostridia bacterium]|nr:NfeD family protein [Clostridia bacterium]